MERFVEIKRKTIIPSLYVLVLIVCASGSLTTHDQAPALTPSRDEVKDRILRDLRLAAEPLPPPVTLGVADFAAAVLNKKDYEDYLDLYISAVDMRNIAVDALLQAKKFLEGGDVNHAAKFADRGLQIIGQSYQLLSAAADTLEHKLAGTQGKVKIFQSVLEEATEFIGSIPGGNAAKVVSLLFLLTDYATDRVEFGAAFAGDEFERKFVRKVFLTALFSFGGWEKLIQQSASQTIGQSGLYEKLTTVVQSEAFRKKIMTVAGKGSAAVAAWLTQKGADELIKAFMDGVNTSVSLRSKLLEPTSLWNENYRMPKNAFSVGQCTWFVHGRLLQEETKISAQLFLRDAQFWLEDAQKAGFFMGTLPAKHAVAFWKSIGGSEWGHVAFVEDDSGKVTESNIGPDKTSMIVVMRDNDDVYYEDRITRQRLKLQLGSPLPQSVRIPSESVWKLEEYATDSKTGKVEWGRVNAVEFANWLQNSGSKLTLPKDKQRIWFKRDWHGVEGNFTGIRLAAGEPVYGKPNKYIYLSEHCSAGTGAPLLTLRGAPGLDQTVAGTVAKGAKMQVVEGPIRAGAFVWWKLSCQAVSGWAPTESKLDTTFEAAKYGMVEVTEKLLWFHGSMKAYGTFYVATRDNKLMERASLGSRKIRDLPVGTENTVIGGPSDADRRVWWNLTVGPDTGWAIVDRWGFTYPKD